MRDVCHVDNVQMLAVVNSDQGVEGPHQRFSLLACRSCADDEAESIKSIQIAGFLSDIEHRLKQVDESCGCLRAHHVDEQPAIDVNTQGERNTSDLFWFSAHANVCKKAICTLTAENLSNKVGKLLGFRHTPDRPMH